MNKNILLAAAALSVLATAGAANAASISARAGTVAISPSTPYTLARELNYSGGITSAAGVFDTIITANTALNAGTYTVNLSYSGATINAAVSTAAVVQTTACTDGNAAGFESSAGAGATMTLSAGGSQGSNSVSYTLQIPAGAQVSAVCFAPALNVSGPVSVTASIVNQVTGQPVDPSVIQSLVTTTTQGFRVASTADTIRTQVVANGGAFNQLGGDAALGVINVFANSAPGAATVDGIAGIAYKNLAGTPVALTDISSGTVTVNGSTANVNITVAGAATTKSGNTSTASIAALPANGTLPVAIVAADTSATAPQIAPSSYRASGSFTLAPAFSAPLSFTNAALETVRTEGLTYVVPWVSSATQGASTGSRTVIRISRIGGSTVVNSGNVYAQLLNPIRGSAQSNDYALVGTLGASGEVVLSSDTFQNAFGDFGRGDIRLVLTPANGAGFSGVAPLDTNNIVVKRVISQPNGGVSEMDVIAVAGADTPNDVNVPFENEPTQP